MKKKLIISCLLIFQFSSFFAQFGPENGVKKSEPKAILIQNARVYVSPNQVIDHTDLLIVDGKIKELGNNLKNKDAGYLATRWYFAGSSDGYN